MADITRTTRWLLHAAFLLAWTLAVAPAALALDKVTLQLKHTHQFQFAGYYAALEKGYYRDAGLDVTIVEGIGGLRPEREVIAGRADYGIGDSSLLLARAAGKPVVVLGVVFQHSPYALALRRPDGRRLEVRDLKGRRVMIGSLLDELSQADELAAFMQKEGVPLSSTIRLEHSFDVGDLVRGKVDAMSVFVTNEPDYLDRIGFPYDLRSPREAGIDFYGDNLFTSERELAGHPERAAAFRAASLRGWQYALDHPGEIADLILLKYSRRHDRRHLLYEARRMVPLVQPVLVEIGYMNPARWRHIADVYASVGMLPRDVSLDGFMYQPEQRHAAWLQRVLGVFAVLLMVGALIHFTQLARERRRSREAIRLGEARFRTMFEEAPLGIAVLDGRTGEFSDVNARYAQIAGRSAETLRRSHWSAACHPEDIAQHAAQMAQLESGQADGFKSSLRMLRPDGSVVWVDVSVTAMEKDGAERQNYLCMIEDVTEKKQSDALAWQHANFDTLTGLPNRRMFRSRLEAEIVRCRRERTRVAMLFIDLDHFKEVNDTLGHQQGDVLLVEAAQRIRACVRESDTVARLGGDEFTVVLPAIDAVSHVEAVAQKIIDALRAPFLLGEEQAFVSASVGITLYPDDAQGIEDLLKHADQAMYAAKAAGRNRFSYFTPALQTAAINRMRMANDLRAALRGDQFRLYFQPIVHLETGRIHKAEALVRWIHPQRGMVGPLEFIALAETTGLIVDIGDWVFAEAVRWVRRWRQQVDPAFQVSINQSPVEFQREGRYQQWFRQLGEQGLEGGSLVFEITEGLLLDASAGVTDKLLQLRDTGVQVALDDFGTGYSSLAYLKKFDIDYLKIDRTFTRNLAPGSSDLALCEAMVVMAHKLGLRVIAEGVETQAQCDLLRAAGCDYGQGYLFARPLPADEFDALLRVH